MTQAPPVTLADFLRARLDEDEARGRILEETQQNVWGADVWDGTVTPYPDSPARVLAEVEAKRRIVHLFVNLSSVRDLNMAACATAETACRSFAAVYADHPDYRQEWALRDYQPAAIVERLARLAARLREQR